MSTCLLCWPIVFARQWWGSHEQQEAAPDTLIAKERSVVDADLVEARKVDFKVVTRALNIDLTSSVRRGYLAIQLRAD